MALSVVPTNYWLPIAEHRVGTLQWAKSWADSRGFTTDDVRRALNGMDTFTVRRLLDLEQEQAETLYEGILLKGVSAGDVKPEAFKEKRDAFREAI